MYKLRGLLRIRIRELCGVTEGLMVFFDGSAMRRMKTNRIAKRIYVGEWAGSRSVVRPWKRD